MSEFWNNIFRYPRFFFSSLFGLILIILAPFKNLLKNKKLRFFVPIICFCFCFFLFVVIKNMVGL